MNAACMPKVLQIFQNWWCINYCHKWTVKITTIPCPFLICSLIMHIIAKYFGQSTINSLVHTSHTYYWEVERWKTMLDFKLIFILVYYEISIERNIILVNSLVLHISCKWYLYLRRGWVSPSKLFHVVSCTSFFKLF